MCRRLLITYLLFTAVLLLGTELPLAFALARSDHQQLVIRRMTESSALASAAQAESVTVGPGPSRAWRDEADAYSRRHGATVLLFDARGRQVYGSRPGTRLDGGPECREVLDDALAGRSGVPPGRPLLTGARPVCVAEPVLRQGEPAGAVVTATPPRSLAAQVADEAPLFLAVALAAPLVSALVAVPLLRWSLSPTRQLQAAVRRIRSGEHHVRAEDGQDGPDAGIAELATEGRPVTARLVSVLEAQRSFVADVSHQMRNPLTALRLRVEALEPLVPAAGRESLTVAVAEADRLSRILDELLTLANASADDSGATTVEVRSVAEARAQAWSDRAARADITIAVHGRRAAATCLPGVLDQVLDVLLDNAIGFSPPAGRITVRTRCDDTSVYVEVEDEGPGLPDADKRRAADRFWRGRQPDRRKGSGLGLAIATALLAAADARLELRDAHPHGLIARAVLPRLVPASALARADRAGQGPDGRRPAGPAVIAAGRENPG
ncbi:two-component sensor histidine kinase [Streptomyces lucensis JCM 4490]|uniref:histidine kinase n=1 Tax=Streptomyces lucensis JCM 4490 TaxID=1306176 RepID=A0A918MTZ7_9ACTN|nr:HAMP domain-containing sensor histidine kinase [Streptomyces lucensis]GGW71999.1 two-component sensor histidine kinase [Streptomyces lucensis JCM 4490]